MSTDKEKREGIKHAVEAARRGLRRLQALKEASPELFEIDRAKQYEMDAHQDCIARGEKLLASLKESE